MKRNPPNRNSTSMAVGCALLQAPYSLDLLVAYPTHAGRVPKLWGPGHGKVFLSSETRIRRAIRYVEGNPTKEGKPPQHWSFVVAFVGSPAPLASRG